MRSKTMPILCNYEKKLGCIKMVKFRSKSTIYQKLRIAKIGKFILYSLWNIARYFFGQKKTEYFEGGGMVCMSLARTEPNFILNQHRVVLNSVLNRYRIVLIQLH